MPVQQKPDHTRATSSRSRPEVSVIIVTYNSEHQIEACLESVIEQQDRTRIEIIVVDNGSIDGTVKIIKSKYPQVRLFDTGQNLGFAKGCNFAVSQSNADYFLHLNPDTVILDKAIDKVLDFAIANPKHGYYGGRTLKEDGSTLERSSCWGTPSLWSLFTFATGLSTILKHNGFFDPESLGSWQRDTVREVGVITGCFLFVERSAWERLNGFDEHYWLYGEDVDLSVRARKANYLPVVVPDAVVIHEIGQSSTSAQKGIWLQQGKVSFINRNWKQPARSLGLLFLKAGILLRATIFYLKGNMDNQWVASWKRKSEWQNGHTKGNNSAHNQ